MGTGVIVCDHHGSFMAARRTTSGGAWMPEFAEALALWHAVQFAQEEGVDKVIFKSDCLSLI
jgi:hypothetical protein